MLEQAPRNLAVEKSRASLLLEADFNSCHKINFNGRMMTSLEDSSETPQEITRSVTSQDASHLDLSKKNCRCLKH